MNNSTLSAANASSSPAPLWPPPIVMQINFGLQCVESPAIFALILVSLLNAWMVLRSAVLHANLKAILLVQSMLIFVYAVDRFIFLFCIFTGLSIPIGSLLKAIALFTITFANLIGHVMIVERTWATLSARQYEHQNRPWFSVCWISAMIAIFVWAQLAPSYFAYGMNTGFGFIALATHFALVLSFVELICFCLLNMYNRKNYNRFNSIRANWTHQYQLSERYQLLQNIYTGRQLAPSFIFHLINILCSNTTTIFMVYLPSTTLPPFLGALIFEIIFVVHAYSKLGIEITVITFHPRLKRNLQKMLKKFRSLLPLAGRTSTVDAYQNGDGEDLGEQNGQERQNRGKKEHLNSAEQRAAQDKHFKMLEHFWQ